MDAKKRSLERAFALILLSVLVGCMTGCVTRLGDFSVMSTGVPQYPKMDSAPVMSHVTGRDGRFWLLFIPFGSAPIVEDAVDDCQDQGPGDFVERARIHYRWWTALLFSYEKYTCTGDVRDSKYGKRQVVPD